MNSQIYPYSWFPLLLIAMLLTVSAFSLGYGPLSIQASKVVAIIAERLGVGVFSVEGFTAREQLVIWQLRLPRLLLAFLVGAGLAVAGAAMQGLFRNPLADPGLLGISSGGALGAVAVIVLGDSIFSSWINWLGDWSVPIAAFIGGLVSTSLIYWIARRSKDNSVATLLLAGIAINALAGALTGILTYVAEDSELRSLTFWTMGSLGRADWETVQMAAFFIVVPLLLLPLFAKALNALLMGEHVAEHIGFSSKVTRRAVVVLTAMIVGASVAVAGIIGFIGLVIPHIIRLFIGPDHRTLFPTAALAGGLLLATADIFARNIAAPAEVPVGLLMAILGGPFFLLLLLRGSR